MALSKCFKRHPQRVTRLMCNNIVWFIQCLAAKMMKTMIVMLEAKIFFLFTKTLFITPLWSCKAHKVKTCRLCSGVIILKVMTPLQMEINVSLFMHRVTSLWFFSNSGCRSYICMSPVSFAISNSLTSSRDSMQLNKVRRLTSGWCLGPAYSFREGIDSPWRAALSPAAPSGLAEKLRPNRANRLATCLLDMSAVRPWRY